MCRTEFDLCSHLNFLRAANSLASEIERAKSEAQRSFGNSRLLIERYIEGGKHIEVQIFGDSHGTVFAFGERECSVQRRHQKIIEETPSPALTPTLRAKMCASAVQIGKLLAYEGAATVEYIFDTKTGDFFFLEVNTRLQVEHPVTEMTRGLDLVSLQLYVASGGKLSDLAEVVNSEAKVSHCERLPALIAALRGGR